MQKKILLSLLATLMYTELSLGGANVPPPPPPPAPGHMANGQFNHARTIAEGLARRKDGASILEHIRKARASRLGNKTVPQTQTNPVNNTPATTAAAPTPAPSNHTGHINANALSQVRLRKTGYNHEKPIQEVLKHHHHNNYSDVTKNAALSTNASIPTPPPLPQNNVTNKLGFKEDYRCNGGWCTKEKGKWIPKAEVDKLPSKA